MPTIQLKFKELNDILAESHARLNVAANPEAYIKELNNPEVLKASKKGEKIVALETKIGDQLKKWSLCHTASTEELNFNTVEDKSDLIHKVKMQKICNRIMKIAVAVFIILALLTPLVTVFFQAVLITSGILLGLAALTALGNLLRYALSAAQGCEKRVNVNQNFQEFIQTHLKAKLHFVPSQNDLLDAKLHTIYLDWKKEAKAILNCK
jgi:hypothetical protein